jgi:uncharacterized protein
MVWNHRAAWEIDTREASVWFHRGRSAEDSVPDSEGSNVKQPGVFLTAEWVNLLMLNYAVDPAQLLRFVPSGTELDAFAGRTYVSLIGFEFNQTRVAGIHVPLHQSFEEVNLRFYVRRGSRRGVVFIRELVPKRAVAMMARFAFNENYSCVPMAHALCNDPNTGCIAVEYAWGREPGRCRMRAETSAHSFLPADGSLAQFITEHYWGYSAQRDGRCLEYEVRHPKWQVREADRAEFSGDAARIYGAEFAHILAGRPENAFLAEGSTVKVFRGTRIE